MDGSSFLSKLEYYKETFDKPLVVEGGILNMVKYEDGTSIAQVASWQEYGTDKIPPRPFMRPTMTEQNAKYTELVTKWVSAGLDRDTIGNRLSLTLAGDIKESISKVHAPVLARYTLYNRQRRGNPSIKPLVDTGILIGSIAGRYK